VAEVDGKVVMQSPEGHLYQVAPEDVATVTRDHGWSVAGDDTVQKRLEERAQYAQYGSTGQQALGAAETAVRTATLGAVPGFGRPEDVAGRSQVLREESPVTNFLAQAAGAAAPALATGGALGAAGIAEAGAAGVVGGALEGAAGGTAAEVEQARQENRPVSVGNILMYGVGGELVGRALPALLRSGASAVRGRLGQAATEAAGEGVLAGAERRALESAADVADGVPLGPDRDVFLANAHKEIIDRASERGAKALDQLHQDVAELSGEGAKRAKVKNLMAPTNAEQRQWAADTSQAALDLRSEIGPRPGKGAPAAPAAAAPVSLEGKTLEDLRALPIDDASDLARVQKLKENPEFAKTGRVSSNDGRQGITLVDDGGDLVLRDGRHRLQAAQELGRDTVYGRYVDGESGKVLFEGEIPLKAAAAEGEAGAATRTSFDAPELQKPLRDVQKTLTRGSEQLDGASEAIDWHEAAGKLDRELSRHEERLASLVEDGIDGADALRSKVADYRATLRADRERGDLWGEAGDYQRSINKAYEDRWRSGSREVRDSFGREMADGQVRFDPAALRKHLSADEIGRGLMPEQLQKQLEGAEGLIAAHREYGTASEAQLNRMQNAVDSVREQLRLSDDVRGAKARMAEREGVARESAKFDREQAGAVREQRAADARKAEADAQKSELLSNLLGAAAGAAAHSFGLGAVVAVGTKALRMSRLLGTLGRTGEATVASAARGAVLGNAGRALRAAEAGAGAVGKLARPVAQTAIARFQGDYPSVQTAFEARRKTLESVAQNPLVLHKAIAQHLGPLSKVHPDAYGQISARLQAAVQYLHENLPSQMSASMVRPNGIPLSRATARDFAQKYNSALNPASVFEDVRDGTATPTQMRTLAAVHPDLYSDLRLSVTRQVAQNPGTMSTQKKLRLDILLGGDGLAGRAYAWPLANAIKAYDAERVTGSVGKQLSASTAQSKAAPARGLSAIKHSVTNA
jgi:hypothetical protein